MANFNFKKSEKKQKQLIYELVAERFRALIAEEHELDDEYGNDYDTTYNPAHYEYFEEDFVDVMGDAIEYYEEQVIKGKFR